MSVDDLHSQSLVSRLIHEGQQPERWSHRALVPPIVNSTTFKQLQPGECQYDYSRSGNPTRECLESSLASLENAKFALAFSSGLGATTALMFLLRSGDHIIAGNDLYGGTFRLLDKCVTASMGISVDFVDCRTCSNISSKLGQNTRMVLIESPTNPLLRLCDIRSVVDALTAHKSSAIVVVDNTFATPIFQKPLDLGAHVVLHSLTKYINGHSDVVMGAIMTNNEAIYTKLKFLQNALGIVPSPFDCFLVNRGLKTLPIRMERHFRSAFEIAKHIDGHPKVSRVIYPLLESHPQYRLAKQQMSGFSGMISLVLNDNCLDRIKKFASSLKVFTLAESLGGYDSLLCVPALMTHASIDEDVRNETGLDGSIIRISVGLEEPEILIKDLEQAFEHVEAVS